MKEFLASLSLLKQPELGCPLFVYLSIREASISAVKVREDGKSQCPVYFVSKVLHGAELRYSEVEKVTLALVNAAMRLPRTDHPLSSILGKIDTSGRLVKWAVGLGQFDIHYEPRTAINAQALADFIQETTRMAEEREWKLYMDGSATRYGAGARIVLISPEEDELEFAIKLQYKASNNEAEYEAFLQGLRLAEKAGAKRVKAYTDSQLVTQQLGEKCEIKEERMKSYADQVRELESQFNQMTIEQIAQTESQRADFLAKIGNSLIDFRKRQIFVLGIDFTPRV